MCGARSSEKQESAWTEMPRERAAQVWLTSIPSEPTRASGVPLRFIQRYSGARRLRLSVLRDAGSIAQSGFKFSAEVAQ